MERRRGRPRHPDVLTPAEWRVLEEVRRGRPNAEIAVRLGISVNTVRYHVSNMLGKLGLPDREALRRWQGRPRMRWGLLALGLAGVGGRAAVVLVAAFAVAGLVRVLHGTEVEPAPAAAVEPPAASVPAAARALPTPAPLPLAQHADYRVYTPEELEDAGFVNTGRFLSVPGNPFPAAESSYRAEFTAVRVAGNGYVDFEDTGGGWARDPTLRWSSTVAVGLLADVDELRLSLTLSGPGGVAGRRADTAVMVPNQDIFIFYSLEGRHGRPELMVGLHDRDGRSYPVMIDDGGRLWVRPAPIAVAVVAYDTGEAFDEAEAARLGPLPKGVGNWSNLTWCEGGVCRATVHTHEGGGLPAPVAGTATCEEGTESLTVEVDAGDHRLRFEAGRPNAIVPPGCEGDFPRQVSEGEMLSRHASWSVTAFDAEGRQISVASDDERWLYIGGFEPTITECPPCRQGA